MKIFAAHGRTGAAFYRLRLPLGDLGRQRGFSVTLKPGHKPISSADFAGSDVIVGQRVDQLARWDAAGANAKLVYEIDDDVFSVLPDNKFAYADYQRPELRRGTELCIARADLVTVSTEPLAEVMLGLNPNVVVLPNYVPSMAFELPTRGKSSLRLGWAGGASHARNVEMIAAPVRRFLSRSPGWSMQLVGTDYCALFKHAGFTPWIDVGEQPEAYYSALSFDIGVAPLIDNQFNRCKSPLRILECAARSIPVIASDVIPYREWIEDGVSGFLVQSEHQWLSRIAELAADDNLRMSMGAAAKAKALANAGHQPWATAYSLIVAS